MSSVLPFKMALEPKTCGGSPFQQPGGGLDNDVISVLPCHIVHRPGIIDVVPTGIHYSPRSYWEATRSTRLLDSLSAGRGAG